jgi:hypothetical protein
MSVKATTCYVIFCDGCGGELESDYHIPHFDSVVEAREGAREVDWTTGVQVRPGVEGDWCDDCAPTGGES